MIMGPRVRIRLGAPFDILRFVKNLLFPFFNNSQSDVDERDHRLGFQSTRDVVTSWRRGKFFDSHA